MVCLEVLLSGVQCGAGVVCCCKNQHPPLVILQDAIVKSGQINSAQGEPGPLEVAGLRRHRTALCYDVIQVEKGVVCTDV